MSNTSPAGAFGHPTTAGRAPSVVFVVDDDVSVRESLAALIRWAGWDCEAFASAEAFLARRTPEVPSCLVLDIALPDRDGLALQEQLARERREMPIIFVTGCGDVPMSVRAMKAGAAEFLTKPFDRDVMIAAIDTALAKSRDAIAAARDLESLRERHASLTPRERQVFAWIATGLLNKQVGGELGVTEATVKAHRGRVMLKMKAGSLADLVRMAARLDVSLPPHRSS